MDFKKTSHWNYDNLNEGFIFCIQRFQELLFDYTIDSYKPRALNAPSLCIELNNVINDVENEIIDANNIKYIIDELKESLHFDFIAKKLIDSDIDYYLPYNESTPLSKLSLRVSVLERSLERHRYIDCIKNELFEAVKDKNKDKINFLTSNFVTTYINYGISKTFLYRNLNKYFFNDSFPIENEECLKEFLDKISPIFHNYKVYVRVTKNITLLEDSFKFFKIRVLDEIKDDVKEAFEKHNYKIPRGYKIIEASNFQVPDPYVARDLAERRLETLRNTSQLFFHGSHLKWKKSAIVIQSCCDKETLIASNQINPMHKTRNYKSSDVSKNTNTIFQNLSFRGENLKKFMSVIERHSNCIENLTPENQIVNLWTIIETLVPMSKNKSKIQSICDCFVPILLLNYTSKLIENLYHDLCRWDKDTFFKALDQIEYENSDSLIKLYILLTDTKYESLKKQLYIDFDTFSLLRNRTYKLSSILSSKKKILAHIERHEQNLVWQLRRIYRTRNMIVHSGKSPKYINILIENCHDYIDQIVSEIINMATSKYRIKLIDQAFELGKILNSELERSIKNSDNPHNYIELLIRDKII